MKPSSRFPAWRATIRREMGAIGIVVALLAVAGLVLWQRGTFTEDRPDVPSCPELVKTLPTAAGGIWAMIKPDPSRRKKPSTFCELSFISADDRYSGTVSVLIVGDTDEERLRREVRNAACSDPAPPHDAANHGYLAFQACDGTVGALDGASVLAAKKPRSVHMTVTIARRPGTHAEAIDFARNLARAVADEGLTVPASE
jgi:hypothetical protein